MIDHYYYINNNITIKKYRACRARMSPEDIKFTVFYIEMPEEIRQEYDEERKKAVKVR